MMPILSVLLFFASIQTAVAGLWEDLRFVNIPAGSFEMGSTDGYTDERPVHMVKVNDFFMMDHELTVGEARHLVKLHPGLITVPPGDNDQLPVTVTYVEANAIASKLSMVAGKKVRLPTEPEWEYAARGGLKQKQYPWGNPQDKFRGENVHLLLERVLGGEECHPISSVPIGPVRSMSPSNAYGLYDMAGNVWEWTSSTYRPYPYKPQAQGDKLQDQGRRKKSTRDMIVIRGGGQADESCDVRVAFRGYAHLDSSYGVRFVTEK
nr:SUMF1/EgtB/PvdO family nonheme iron enzyme [Nitrosomonas nitrosa]